MLPPQLTAESFKTYPPKARALAIANLPLLKELPLAFTPFLLREIITYDWKFPKEQVQLTSQFDYLTKLWPTQRKREMEPFESLKLNDNLESSDWVNKPAQFLEQLSAHLWATQQMDTFRDASETYVRKLNVNLPSEELRVPRLGIVVLGEGVAKTEYKLFQKLRRRGVYFSKLDPAQGLAAIADALRARATAQSTPFAHWHIEGSAITSPIPGYASVTYDGLSAVRAKLSSIMLSAYESPKFDPEQLRTKLAALTPESVGITGAEDGPLERFQLSLLTEGSGTQVYSTTFVQWAAREALRRAEPLTIYSRYSPRQKERTMDELLSGNQKAATDPEGSLIDADMAAYYTWINIQRLSGADNARFLAWFEGHNQAVAIAPGLKPATEEPASIDMAGLLKRVLYS